MFKATNKLGGKYKQAQGRSSVTRPVLMRAFARAIVNQSGRKEYFRMC